MVSKLIFEISTFKWGGTTALDPDTVGSIAAVTTSKYLTASNSLPITWEKG